MKHSYLSARGSDDYFNQKINYGGETRTRAEVISEMQGLGVHQRLIDAYMMGTEYETRQNLRTN
jgi:hypothetical protein